LRVGSKVRVPRLNWHDAEIVKVKPFWDDATRSNVPPDGTMAFDDLGTMYLVQEIETNEMRWCISGDLILKA